MLYSLCFRIVTDVNDNLSADPMGDQHEASAGRSPRRGASVIAPDHTRVGQGRRAVGDHVDHLHGDLRFRSGGEREGNRPVRMHNTRVGAFDREGLRTRQTGGGFVAPDLTTCARDVDLLILEIRDVAVRRLDVRGVRRNVLIRQLQVGEFGVEHVGLGLVELRPDRRVQGAEFFLRGVGRRDHVTASVLRGGFG